MGGWGLIRYQYSCDATLEMERSEIKVGWKEQGGEERREEKKGESERAEVKLGRMNGGEGDRERKRGDLEWFKGGGEER